MLNAAVLMLIGCFNPGAAIKRPPIKTIPSRAKLSDDVQYHILRAMLHDHENNWDAANTHFEFASKIKPRDPFIFMHWGNAALRQGKNKIAIARYEDALGRFGVHRPDLRAKIRSKIDLAARQ